MPHSIHSAAKSFLLIALLVPVSQVFAAEVQLGQATTELTHAAVPQAAVSSRAMTQYDSGDPHADEQLVLEYINRARANPTAEGTRLGIDITEGLTPQQATEIQVRPPLAMNAILLTIARAHSADMYTNNYFAHNDLQGNSPSQRVSNAGYQYTFAGENIATSSSSTGAQLEDLLMVDSLEPGRGHRVNLLSIFDNIFPVFQEIGIGMTAGATPNPSGYADFLTQDFGTTGAGSFLLGVVYNDQNGNNFYDIGEGVSRITITPSLGNFFAVSSTSGGYAIPIPSSGTLTLTASGGSLPAPITKMVTLNGSNIKVDFLVNVAPTGTGTNSSTGAGTSTGTGTGGNLMATITSFTIKENLVHSNTTISFGGALPITSELAIAGTVNIGVGNLLSTFQVNSKGVGGQGANSFKIRIKLKKGVISPSSQNAPFAVKLSGDFASALAGNGLTGTSATVNLSVALAYSGNTYLATVPMTFTSNGRTGKTQFHK